MLFSIRWEGGASLLSRSHAQWALNYVDDKNFLLCELDDGGFQVGKAKRTPIAKQSSYTIRISIKPDGIVQELQTGLGGWKPLSTVPVTTVAGGKFGFLVPHGQTLFLANFSFQPDH
jgi:hypothetical protein